MTAHDQAFADQHLNRFARGDARNAEFFGQHALGWQRRIDAEMSFANQAGEAMSDLQI